MQRDILLLTEMIDAAAWRPPKAVVQYTDALACVYS